MKKSGSVEEYLWSVRRKKGVVVFGLIDPDMSKTSNVSDIVKKAVASEIDAFLVGGSSFVDQYSIDKTIDVIRNVSVNNIPVILFPGNVNGLSPKADAVLFMSLLNSCDPYYIIGAQVQGAPIIRYYGLEVLPTGYIVLYSDSAVSHIGRVHEIPVSKPEILSMYVLAAEMMGMRFVYLEGGSGSRFYVPGSVVRAARSVFGGFLIVGGGLRSPEAVREVVLSGADGIVLGTVLEVFDLDSLRELVIAARRS